MWHLILILLLTSCAFKAEDPLKQSQAGIARAGSRMAELSWEDSSSSIIRLVEGAKHFSIPDPVSLPPEVPDRMRITFNAPLVSGKLLQEPRVFISDVTNEKSIEPPFRLKGILDASGILISGLKTFFSLSKEQRGVLRISLINAVTGDEEASIGLTLATTPTSIGIAYIEKSEIRDQELRRLQAPEMRLDLVAAIKVRNTNSRRAEFFLPTSLKGFIRKYYRRHDTAPRHCHTDTGFVEWTDSFPARYFIFPLGEASLQKNWISFLSEGNWPLTLDPAEERILGVYGSGPEIAAFSDNGAPTYHPSNIQVVTGCDRKCGQPLFAGFEIGDPGGPGDHSRCWMEPVVGPALSGLESKGAYWSLEEASTRISVRNAFLSKADDPASREISFIEPERYVF